jgi:prophage regulatory protein
MTSSDQSIRKILRLKQVIERTGLSRSTIYDRMDPKSSRYDQTFPTPIKLNANATNSTGAVGWLESSLDQWIEQRCSAH